MARERELTGIVRPELDDQALDREMSTLEERMGEASRIVPDLNLRGLGRKLENLMPGGRQFRQLRQTIGSLRGRSDGRQSQPTGGSTTGTSIAAAQLEKLGDIEDELKKQGVQAAQTSGGGVGDMVRGGLAYRGITSLLSGTGGGGLAGMLATGKSALGRSGAASLMLSGQFGKGGLMRPGDKMGLGSDLLGQTLLSALGQNPEDFTTTVPGPEHGPNGERQRGSAAEAVADIGQGEFEFTNPMKDWTVPESFTSLDWENPTRGWQLPSSLQNLSWENPTQRWQLPDEFGDLNWKNPLTGWQLPDNLVSLDWDNPIDDWQPPGWLQDAINLLGVDSDSAPAEQTPSQSTGPNGAPSISPRDNSDGSPRENRAKSQQPGIDVTLEQTFDLDLRELRRELDRKKDEAVDEAVKEIESRLTNFGGRG